MSTDRMPRILIVDDEVAQLRALCDTLRECGYHTAGFSSGAAALEGLQAEHFDVLLTDLMMPGMDGIALLERAREIDGDIASVIMTGRGTIATAVDAMKSGALDYILKPFKLSLVLPVLERALAIRDLRIANAELQRSVQQRTVELETANKELEAFARSISHDLRSPLMVVMNSLDELNDDFGASLSPEVLQCVGRAAASADRMKCLIEDLLRLSRIGRHPLDKREIKVVDLVSEVLEEVKANHPGRQVEVRYGELPDCRADPGLIRQVFVNLLSNAFKFTRGVPKPVIDVTCMDSHKERTYLVKDNGAGFDMRQAKNLFGPFQRLHGADRFEGTGVGLSIVHRIVERHGGRVWAEAQPGRGATFYFTVPQS